MNIRTATSEVPENIKPRVANAEAFGEAIRDPRKRTVVQEWVDQDRKSQKAESDIESTYIQGKRAREGKNAASNKYVGAYSKAPPETGIKMATIEEYDEKKEAWIGSTPNVPVKPEMS